MTLLLASEVMLEFPAMVFALLAIECIRDLEGDYPWKRAYLFAFLAATAVWTKQHTVFLGLIPFLLILLRRDWRMLRSVHLWGSSFLFGLAVLAWSSYRPPVQHAGVSRQFATRQTVVPAIMNSLWFYHRDFRYQVGYVFVTWTMLSAAAYFLLPSLRRQRQNHVYLALIFAVSVVLLPAASHEFRYCTYALPAFFVFAYGSLGLLCKRLLPARYAGVPCMIVAAYMALAHVVEFEYCADPKACLQPACDCSQGPIQPENAVLRGKGLVSGSRDACFENPESCAFSCSLG